MSNIPKGLYYTKEHEWIRIDGSYGYIGVTDYAQDALGDIAYVELPQVGIRFDAGEVLATIESPKAVSEVFMPICGEVVEVNAALDEDPGVINEGPYENWIAKVALDGAVPTDLLEAAAYAELLRALEE